MNRNEALQILGLTSEASEEEVKKKYRELTKQYHPDINKTPDAEDKFKKINAAYSAIQNPEPVQQQNFHPGINLDDLLRNFQSDIFGAGRVHRQVKEIKIPVTITFDESVKGCQKEISITRDEACSSCRGGGFSFIPKATPCATCNDKGRIETAQGNMRFSSTCPTCHGMNKIKVACKGCNGTAVKSATRLCKIEIPEGVISGNMLRLAGMGNFAHAGFGVNYLDAFVNVTVTPRHNMTLVNSDVISNIEVSLLDCLQGTTRKEETVYGEVEIKIPPMSKNKDEVSVPGHGVRSVNGSHKFIIKMNYPQQTDKFIELLKSLEN